MKITDFALVFIAIILPFMLVLYINITFTIKAEEMEMYYQTIIDTACEDAAYEMKQVESQDKQIDYGYSDNKNKKINVNAEVGVNSFFESMYNVLGIKGNEVAESYFDLFVPAVAVIEYDGIRVSKNETVLAEDGSTQVQRVLKPKRYFTYTYSIIRKGEEYKIIPGYQTGCESVHTIEFTMDSKVTHRGYDNYDGEIQAESFYLEDKDNNDGLISGVIGSESRQKIKSEIVSHLTEMRSSIISSVVSDELSNAVNENNVYARQAGIVYSFSFPATSQDEMYNMIDGVGIVAFVQGISVGNKYLNTKALGTSTLENATRYYFTAPSNDSQIHMNLYHKDLKCPEYQLSKIPDMSPRYSSSKQQAATAITTGTLNNIKQTFTGFYPCPICNP